MRGYPIIPTDAPMCGKCVMMNDARGGFRAGKSMPMGMMMGRKDMPMMEDKQCTLDKDMAGKDEPKAPRGMMGAPHGMMKYHQYDKDGNIILDEDVKNSGKKDKPAN
jgi:hypothetical protein